MYEAIFPTPDSDLVANMVETNVSTKYLRTKFPGKILSQNSDSDSQQNFSTFGQNWANENMVKAKANHLKSTTKVVEVFSFLLSLPVSVEDGGGFVQ